MDVLSSVWILICWICSAESQYLISPFLTLSWTNAHVQCGLYGHLADRDTVVKRVDRNILKNCTAGSQFWLGNSLYRTKYIYYKGCYNVHDSFEIDGIYMVDKSWARCQMHCYYLHGFVIKGHACKCLNAADSDDKYSVASPSRCEFVCLPDNCGFYGGNDAVSIYITYDPLKDDTLDTLEDINCLYFECNGVGQELQKSPCTMQPGISAFCENGYEKENVESWESATEFCRQNGSNLIENRIMGQNCGNNRKFWSNVRRFEIDIISKDNNFGQKGRIGCAVSDSDDLEIDYSASCYDENKYFLCITDDANLLAGFRCYIEFSSLSTPLDHQSGTETTSSMISNEFSTLYPADGLLSGTDNANTTVIGVVVGLLCCAAVGLSVFMILCIRRKRALAEHVQIKENKTCGKSIGYMRVKARYIIFSSTSQTWFSANQKCKTEYNGSLADIDEIKEGSNNRKFTTCLNGSDELWTGELLYTTGYIAYKGCYSVPDNFHHDSVQIEEMTIAKCQLNCRYYKGFAIKDKYCRCIASEHSLQEYSFSNLTDCSFICSGQYCGFYGGNSSVGLYVEGRALQTNFSSPSELCLVSKCLKPSTGALRIQYEQSRCDKQSGISVYCENGVTRNYFSSWNDAMAYCVGYRSHLITINNSNCKYGSRMWCNERKYQEIIRAKGFSVTEDVQMSCIYTNVTQPKKSLTNCFRNKNFACVTDESVSGKCVFTLNESKIEFETSTSSRDRNVLSTSIPPYLPQNNSTDSNNFTSPDNSSQNNNTYGHSKAGNNDKKIIIGITVGITCVIAAAVLTFIVYWKRNGCVQIKRKPAANASTETTFVSASSSHKRSKEHKGDGGKTPDGYFYNKKRDAPKDMEASYNDCFESDNSEQADHTYCGLGERTESNYDVIIKEKRRQSENYEIPMSNRLYENVTIK